jgi:hypothetical protein
MTTLMSDAPEAGHPSRFVLPEAPPAVGTTWHPALLAVPVAIALAVLGLTIDDGSTDAEEVLRAVLVVAWALAGALLASRRPLCRLGVLLLGGTVVGGAAFAGAAGSSAGWVGVGGDLVHGAHHVGTFVLAAVALHLLLALPRGELAASRRAVVIGAYVLAAGTGLALWAGPHEQPRTAIASAWILALVVGLPGAHATYLRTAGLERQRVQWVGCGA